MWRRIFAALLLGSSLALSATARAAGAQTPNATPTSTPAVTLSAQPAELKIAVGARAIVSILGASGAIATTASAPLLDTSVDTSGATVTVTGRQLGSVSLHVVDQSGAGVDVPIAIVPPAGVVPPRVALTITGRPAEAAFLGDRVRDALDRAIRPALQPNALLQYGALYPAPQALGAGFETTYTVPVTIVGGPESASVSGLATVDVDDLDAPPFVPRVLYFDDDPETIAGDGVLFRRTVEASHDARLFYYHENTLEPRRLVVVLSSAKRSSRVALVDAPAGPDADVMNVGQAVSRSFLQIKPRDEGLVVNLAPGKTFVQRDATLAPGQVVSAALDLRVLAGGAVTITALAIPPDADPSSYLDSAPLAGDGHGRHGAFALDGIEEKIVAYTLGGPDASTVYGARERMPSNLDAGDPGRDLGDYGVLQRITFDVDNPGARVGTVYLYEKPLGGGVRSVFLVDGAVIELGCARLPNRYEIASFQIAPHAGTELHLWSMTGGGSSYPLEVGVTATPPSPTTPPLSAPDGCFPKSGVSAAITGAR
jgi:hypothetical protein